MKIVYLDCSSGISGDMLLGALVDAGSSLEVIQTGLQSLGLGDCRVTCTDVKRQGFRAKKIRVEHPPQHVHRHLHHITQMIDGSSLDANQKELAKRVFVRLAEAEARVHGTTIEKVHFHEIGAVDSIADIVGTAIAWSLLRPDRVYCAPVPVGGGTVQIAHGRVAVPAPATAELLKGIPLATSTVQAELTTPTGAALLATLVDEFTGMPAMTVQTIGYGAGERDLKEQPNILRLFIGETAPEIVSDVVWVLETNLDDTSGEILGHTMTKLLEAGALDVFMTPIQMKKNRPGVILTTLCHGQLVEKLERILFRETGSLGIRRWPASRHKLSRHTVTVQTPWGPVQGTVAELETGVRCFSPEYDSCRQLAQQSGLALRQVYEAARAAFQSMAVPKTE